MGIYSLITEIPFFIQKIYPEVLWEPSGLSTSSIIDLVWVDKWPTRIFRILLPILLIVFAKPLSDYFALKMGEESSIEMKEAHPNE